MTTVTALDNIRAQVQEYVLDVIASSESQNEAARQLGLSAAHLINFREGNWDKISDKLFRQIAAKAKIDQSWSIAPTTNFIIATSLLNEAKRLSRMFGLVGFTGSGKSHALQLFCRKTPASYYALAHTEMNKRQFLYAIARATGVRLDNIGMTNGDMLDAICEKLNGDDKPLLVLDDAGKLPDPILRIVQIIYDRTERRCGIVLAGTEYMQESIEKKARRNKLGFRELKRRVAWWEQMGNLSRKDVASICETNGVTDEGAIGFLSKNVSDFGTLRNLIESAKDRADGGEITRPLLAEMIGSREIYTASWAQ